MIIEIGKRTLHNQPDGDVLCDGFSFCESYAWLTGRRPPHQFHGSQRLLMRTPLAVQTRQSRMPAWSSLHSGRRGRHGRAHDVSRPETFHGFLRHQVGGFRCYRPSHLPFHSRHSLSSVQRLHAFDPKDVPTEPRGLTVDRIRKNTISANWPDVLRSVATMASGRRLLAELQWFAGDTAERGAAHGISRALRKLLEGAVRRADKSVTGSALDLWPTVVPSLSRAAASSWSGTIPRSWPQHKQLIVLLVC